MKKYSLFSRALTLVVLATVVLMSCKKEQSEVADTIVPPATDNSGLIVSGSGNGPYSGSIDQSYAAALAGNYAKKYDDDDQVQYVSFKADELISFLQNLKAKYKSDYIYVNFGVYGKGAKPVSSKDWGRLTVFFTGNKIPATIKRRTEGVMDLSDDEFLNHGQIYP
jgi:hypothetical protein